MKTAEELNALKEELETLNKKLADLTDEELTQISGGIYEEDVFSVGDWIMSGSLLSRLPSGEEIAYQVLDITTVGFSSMLKVEQFTRYSNSYIRGYTCTALARTCWLVHKPRWIS